MAVYRSLPPVASAGSQLQLQNLIGGRQLAGSAAGNITLAGGASQTGAIIGQAFTWVGIVAGGYTAAQTENYVDDIMGGGAAYLAAGWWGVVVYVASYIFGASRANREERRQLRKAAERRLTFGPVEGTPLPYAFGYVRTPGVNVFGAVGRNVPGGTGAQWKYDFANARPAAGHKSLGGMPAFKDFMEDGIRDPRAGRNAILMAQYVFASTEMTEIYDASVDRIHLVNTDSSNASRVQQLLPVTYVMIDKPGVANAPAGRFIPARSQLRRNSNTKFTNKSNATAFYWQDQDNPMFGAYVPLLDAFGAFGPVKSIIRSGTPGAYTYAMSTTETVSLNPVLIKLWLMENVQKINLDTEVNLETCYEAWERAEIQWSGLETDIALRDEGEPQMMVDPDTGDIVEDTAATKNAANRYGNRLRTPLGRGRPGNNISTGYSPNSYGQYLTNYQKRQWMFSGLIPSEAEAAEQSDIVMETMPGSFWYRENSGKYAISTPDFMTETEDQIVETWDEDVIIGRPYIRQAEGDDRLTSVVVKFNDLSQRLKESTNVVPVPGSNPDTILKAVNNGEENQETLTLEGACDPDQAHSLGISHIMQSHRFVGSVRVPEYVASDVREGSIIRLKFADEGLNHTIRIRERLFINDVAVVTFQQFHRFDYGFYPRNIDTLILPDAPNLSIPAPANVRAALLTDTNYVKVEWDAPVDPENVNGYEVSVIVDPDPVITERTNISVRGNTLEYEFPAADGDHKYSVAVRAYSRNGGHSAWVAITSDEFSFSRGRGGMLYEPVPEGECPQITASRGERLMTPRRNVFLYDQDPWLYTPTQATTIAGQNQSGVLARGKGRVVNNSDNSAYVINFEGSGILLPDAATDIDIVSHISAFWWHHGMPTDLPASFYHKFTFLIESANTGADRVNFVPAIANDIVLAFRHIESESTIFFPMNISADVDFQEPYTWEPNPDVITEADTFFAQTGEFEMIVMRSSRRCIADPLSFWLVEPSLSVEQLVEAGLLFYGELAEGQECPDASLGEGQGRAVFMTRDGRVWTREDSPFNAIIPETVGPDGLNGVLFNVPVEGREIPVGEGRAWVPDVPFPIPVSQTDAPAYFQFFAASNTDNDLGNRSTVFDFNFTTDAPVVDPDQRNAPAATGEFLENIRNDLVFGLRHNASGAFLWGDVFPRSVATEETSWKYKWVRGNDADRRWEINYNVREITDLGRWWRFPGDLTFAVVRRSTRCQNDPFNPWIPRPDFQTGVDGFGVEFLHTIKATNDPLPRADLPASTLAYDAPSLETAPIEPDPDLGTAEPFLQIGETKWFDDPVETTNELSWAVSVSRRITGQPEAGTLPTEQWGDWTPPLFQKTYGRDGRYIEFIYRRFMVDTSVGTDFFNDETKRNVWITLPPETSDENKKIDDFVPTGWTDDEHHLDVDAIWNVEVQWVRKWNHGEEEWGEFVLVGVWRQYADSGVSAVVAPVIFREHPSEEGDFTPKWNGTDLDGKRVSARWVQDREVLCEVQLDWRVADTGLVNVISVDPNEDDIGDMRGTGRAADGGLWQNVDPNPDLDGGILPFRGVRYKLSDHTQWTRVALGERFANNRRVLEDGDLIVDSRREGPNTERCVYVTYQDVELCALAVVILAQRTTPLTQLMPPAAPTLTIPDAMNTDIAIRVAPDTTVRPRGASAWQYQVGTSQANLLAQSAFTQVSQDSGFVTVQADRARNTSYWYRTRWVGNGTTHATSLWSPSSSIKTPDVTPAQQLDTPTFVLVQGTNNFIIRPNLESSADGYDYQFATSEAGLSTAEIIHVTNRGNTIQTAAGGTLQHVRIRATSTSRLHPTSEWASSKEVTPLSDDVILPTLGRLTIASMTNAGGHGVINVTRGTLPPNADGWDIQYSTASDLSGAVLGSSLAIQDVFSAFNLQQGVLYYAQVRATAASGYNPGPWSPSSSVTTARRVEDPDDIILSVPTFRTTAGDRTITITLTSELDTGASGWEYRQSANEAGLTRVLAERVPNGFTARSVTLQNLVNGQRIYVQVRQWTENDGYADSEWSASDFATPTAPNPLTKLRIEANFGTTTASVTRGSLDDRADGWDIQYSTSSDFTSGLNSLTLTRSVSTQVLSRVTAGRTWYVRARQYANTPFSAGLEYGEWSDRESGSLGRTALGRMTVASFTSASPTTTTRSVTVTRGNLPANASGWRIQYSRNASFTQTSGVDITGTTINTHTAVSYTHLTLPTIYSV